MICRAVASLFVLALGVTWNANAQLSEPKAVRGRTVTMWQVEREDNVAHRQTRIVYARNDSTAPIAITQVRLSKCVNLQLACEPFVPEFKAIAPGQVSEVVLVNPANLGQSYSFAFDLDWRTATECIDPRPASAAAANGKTVPPQPRQMIIPNVGAPSELHGQRIDVRFFVADNGRVDSVGLVGITDKGYLAKFRQVMMNYRFSPALDRGCPVPGVTSITVTL
jgi:hypothetical protein